MPTIFAFHNVFFLLCLDVPEDVPMTPSISNTEDNLDAVDKLQGSLEQHEKTSDNVPVPLSRCMENFTCNHNIPCIDVTMLTSTSSRESCTELYSDNMDIINRTQKLGWQVGKANGKDSTRESLYIFFY